jgi:hypothetical protein
MLTLNFLRLVRRRVIMYFTEHRKSKFTTTAGA